MYFLIYLLLLVGTSVAHYHGYESRNFIEREEPNADMDSLVECPVCEMTQDHEECEIDKESSKRFKRCHWDTYFNEKCGNRLDCYRGPGETCTEKMENDIYGQKCAHGCYCDSAVHQCVCVGFKIDQYLRFALGNPYYRYPISKPQFKKPVFLDDILQKPVMVLA